MARRSCKLPEFLNPQRQRVRQNCRKMITEASDILTEDEMLPKAVKLRQNKYLNNQIEQDHHFIKRLVNPGFGSFNTARRTLRGFEAMNMIRIGSSGHRKGDILGQVEYARKFLSCCIIRSDMDLLSSQVFLHNHYKWLKVYLLLKT